MGVPKRSLQAYRREHNPPVALWRAPEVAAGDGSSKAEQAIDNTIVQADHPVQYVLKPVQRFSKGKEVQAMFPLLAPGHGSTQHECRRVKTFLCRSAHMGGGGSVGNLLIVFEATTNGVVAMQDIQSHELA